MAYLLPLIIHAKVAAMKSHQGTKALVVSPTRELAEQITRVLLRLVQGLHLGCCLINTAAVVAGTDFSKVWHLKLPDNSKDCYQDRKSMQDPGFPSQKQSCADCLGILTGKSPTMLQQAFVQHSVPLTVAGWPADGHCSGHAPPIEQSSQAG